MHVRLCHIKRLCLYQMWSGGMCPLQTALRTCGIKSTCPASSRICLYSQVRRTCAYLLCRHLLREHLCCLLCLCCQRFELLFERCVGIVGALDGRVRFFLWRRGRGRGCSRLFTAAWRFGGRGRWASPSALTYIAHKPPLRHDDLHVRGAWRVGPRMWSRSEPARFGSF